MGHKTMVEKWVEFYNAKDMDGLMALYSSDAEVSFFILPPAHGLNEIRALWKWEFQAFPNGKATILKQMSHGSTDMAEWTWTGTNTGPMTMPDGKIIPPTGKTATIMGIDAIEFKGDRITKQSFYFQEISLMKQLGLLSELKNL